jgi:hypothetical protein
VSTVVTLDRARADDHRVAERTQPMQMHDVVGACHAVGIAARRRGAAVAAWPMRDRKRSFAAGAQTGA